MTQLQGQTIPSVNRNRQQGALNIQQLWLGESGVSEVMPRYSALAKSGLVFSARAALQALSAAGTGMVGLQLWNSSSVQGGVDLHILKVSGNIVATSASCTGIALAYGRGQVAAPTGQTAITSQSCDYIGGNLGAGLAYNAGTFTNAPVAQFDLMHNTAAIATTGEDQGFSWDMEGSIIVPPQTYICFVALGAAAAASSTNLNIKWAELSV